VTPLLILAVIALAAGFAWRAIRREHGRVVRALREAESHLGKSKTMVELEKDPKTGVYRPKR
jgi:hypothetical protein